MKELMRLSPFHRIMHIIVAVTFLGLIITGMPLKFASAPWAAWTMWFLGGYKSTVMIHKICGVTTVGYFIAHILFVFYYIVVIKRFRFNLFGPESMVPRLKDLKDIYQNFKWFLGKGPQPEFDRWTYWEKFDYWAVFWGVGVIGFTGFLLWFPEFFDRFLPGWVFSSSAQTLFKKVK